MQQPVHQGPVHWSISMDYVTTQCRELAGITSFPFYTVCSALAYVAADGLLASCRNLSMHGVDVDICVPVENVLGRRPLCSTSAGVLTSIGQRSFAFYGVYGPTCQLPCVTIARGTRRIFLKGEGCNLWLIAPTFLLQCMHIKKRTGAPQPLCIKQSGVISVQLR